MKKENRAIAEMLICASLWSIAGIFIKLIPWNGFVISGIRSLIAGLTMLVYIAAKRYKIYINRKTLTSGIITGLVYTSFVAANKLTTAANAIVLQFTSPVFIVVFSALFLKQKIKRNDLIAVIFTFIGIGMFFFDELENGYILGNFVAIAAGALMAVMYMTLGNAGTQERFSSILIGHMTAFAIGIPFMATTQPEISSSAIICIIILGVVQLGIPYVLYGRASEYCPPLACCLLGALEPLLNPIWVLIFDGEKPGIFALVGAVIVIAAVTLWCAFGNKKEEIGNA